MSRITKQIAVSVSFAMTDKKNKELVELEKNLTDLCYEIAKSKIPKDVFEFFKKNSKYFKTFNRFKVQGAGFNYEDYYFKTLLPCGDNYNICFTLNEKQSNELLALSALIKKSREKLENLRIEIENALISLKTYNKVSTEFKEAYSFLPEKVCKELTINISEIIKKL